MHSPTPVERPRPRPRELPQVGAAAPPPFRLPGEHFLAAVCWLLVAAALLPMVAPRVAQGRVMEPAVFALVHVIVLGVVTSTIFGALYQFVPGSLGVPLRSVAAAHRGFWLLQSGTAVLVSGFWWWHGWSQLVGWLLVFGAVGIVSSNVLPARRRSVGGKLIGLYLSVAHSALGLGMVVALARIGATLGWWQFDRLGAIAAHAVLGSVGFATLTAVGVGSRMLPTFLQAPGDDRRALRVILLVASTALAVFSVGAVTGHSASARLGAVLLLLTGAAIVGLGVRWFRRRGRTLDASLWHVAGAYLCLAIAIVPGAALLYAGPLNLTRWSAMLAALLLGWLVLLVLGVMAKIVSHLSYINLFRQLPGFARVGNPNLLLQPTWLAISAGLLWSGAVGLVVTIEMGRPALVSVAAYAWSAGAALTAANYARMFLLGRRPDPAP